MGNWNLGDIWNSQTGVNKDLNQGTDSENETRLLIQLITKIIQLAFLFYEQDLLSQREQMTYPVTQRTKVRARIPSFPFHPTGLNVGRPHSHLYLISHNDKHLTFQVILLLVFS